MNEAQNRGLTASRDQANEALQASEAQIQELTTSLDEQGADVRRIGLYVRCW